MVEKNNNTALRIHSERNILQQDTGHCPVVISSAQMNLQGSVTKIMIWLIITKGPIEIISQIIIFVLNIDVTRESSDVPVYTSTRRHI